MFLVVTLGACVGTRTEPFAPELEKSYVLTQELVHTELEIVLPGLFNPLKLVPFVMTSDKYDRMRNTTFVPERPDFLPILGEVARGSCLEVKRMFTHNTLHGISRYGEVQFTFPTTREQLTAYVDWNDISPNLREVR